MVFKFFTLTFSLLLAISITVLNVEMTVTLGDFQALLELEGGRPSPAQLQAPWHLTAT